MTEHPTNQVLFDALKTALDAADQVWSMDPCHRVALTAAMRDFAPTIPASLGDLNVERSFGPAMLLHRTLRYLNDYAPVADTAIISLNIAMRMYAGLIAGTPVGKTKLSALQDAWGQMVFSDNLKRDDSGFVVKRSRPGTSVAIHTVWEMAAWGGGPVNGPATLSHVGISTLLGRNPGLWGQLGTRNEPFHVLAMPVAAQRAAALAAFYADQRAMAYTLIEKHYPETIGQGRRDPTSIAFTEAT